MINTFCLVFPAPPAGEEYKNFYEVRKERES